MVNIPESWGPEEIRDIDSQNYYDEIMEIHDNDPKWQKKALAGIQRIGRDNARTPVQWSAEKEAGFTTGKPWIRVHDNYPEVNVDKQLKDPKSPLAFWKQMIKVRREHSDLLINGDFDLHDPNDLDVFTFVKERGDKKAVVYLNFSNEEQPIYPPPQVKDRKQTLLVANVEESEIGKNLSPWEARVYLIE